MLKGGMVNAYEQITFVTVVDYSNPCSSDSQLPVRRFNFLKVIVLSIEGKALTLCAE